MSIDDTHAPEVHRADPAERKRTLILLGIVTLFGVLLIIGVQHELANIRGWLASGEVRYATGQFQNLARFAFALLGAAGVAIGVLVARGAHAVVRQQRYPHAGARLIRDRPVLRGTRAVLLGRLGYLLAAAFAIVGVGGAVIGWRMLANFG